jgi:hypothetical protein
MSAPTYLVTARGSIKRLSPIAGGIAGEWGFSGAPQPVAAASIYTRNGLLHHSPQGSKPWQR